MLNYLITIFLLVSLIILNNMNKKIEGFTDIERKAALDGLTIQNKLLNDTFSKITNNNIEMNKKLIVNNKDITNNKITLGANGIIYTDNLNVKENISVNNLNAKEKIVAKNNLCINNTCVNEEQLKVLTGQRNFFIRAPSKGGILSDQGTAKFQGNKGGWEQMRIEL